MPSESTATPPNQAEAPSAPASAPAPPDSRAVTSLWKHADFLKLWSGESVSLIGTQITLVALPLTAVTLLNASGTQLGLLTALGQLPYVLVMFFGVWADRVRRRPLLIGANVISGLTVAVVPLAFWTKHLDIALMFGVTFVAGLLAALFDVSWSAYLPTLVAREDLSEANSKMQLSRSVAQVSGPGLTAVLLRWLSSASLMIGDAVSYFVAAVLCWRIRKPEEDLADSDDRKPGGVLAAIMAGLRLVFKDACLRPMMLSQALFMFFVPGIQALYYAYAYRDLGISASTIALILTLSGPGAILGSALGPRIIQRIGLGKMCVIAALGGNTSYLLIPLASRPHWLAIAMLAFAQLMFGFTMPLGAISMATMRQAFTPNGMQGVVTAAFRGFSVGLAPLGAVLAGVAGSLIGLRVTILIAAIGVLSPVVMLFMSPLTKVFDVPDALATAPDPNEKK
jgi:predicted MFS family arabinose efflux permease